MCIENLKSCKTKTNGFPTQEKACKKYEESYCFCTGNKRSRKKQQHLFDYMEKGVGTKNWPTHFVQ